MASGRRSLQKRVNEEKVGRGGVRGGGGTSQARRNVVIKDRGAGMSMFQGHWHGPLVWAVAQLFLAQTKRT